ncbi:unnamed protein product [Didymodactylos carnosus]|uniref:Mono(ADP-ribosyl)transferase n=1 Tax=Didymodactylos carnosus TaxID=1234261 RepID=A0A815YGK0_9BILA|nr:unnamed protein product [Didymodactylos carnosus]CAF1571386.1 unnamed protein product [Didymodactylos carnosus]CAF4272535.1 unnamed protein product [Didymodactylos carnosus]CAF4434878.1 unnamed protein product [Didymodactylos carnosus]
MSNLRFFDETNEDQNNQDLLPITGYESMPLVTLEKAVEPIEMFLYDLKDKVQRAKQNCRHLESSCLTQDEAAAIYIYTMEWAPVECCLYHLLNQTLRHRNRHELIPWFSYLKLLLTALFKLPSIKKTVWRGVKLNLQYPDSMKFAWWSFISCTESLTILESEAFLGKGH